MPDAPLPPDLVRALDALTHAWLTAPLPASDAKHALAFAVVRAYLATLDTPQRRARLATLRRPPAV